MFPATHAIGIRCYAWQAKQKECESHVFTPGSASAARAGMGINVMRSSLITCRSKPDIM